VAPSRLASPRGSASPAMAASAPAQPACGSSTVFRRAGPAAWLRLLQRSASDPRRPHSILRKPTHRRRHVLRSDGEARPSDCAATATLSLSDPPGSSVTRKPGKLGSETSPAPCTTVGPASGKAIAEMGAGGDSKAVTDPLASVGAQLLRRLLVRFEPEISVLAEGRVVKQEISSSSSVSSPRAT